MEIRVDEPRLARSQSGHIFAMLKEKDGPRALGINLNNFSFHLMAWELNNVEDKPMIFKFVSESLTALNGNVEKVVIHDLVDAFFQAHVVIKDNRENRTYNLDLHVTDALTLAISAKCPIFVTEETFEKCNKKVSAPDDDAAKRFFDGIDPNTLTKH